MNKESKLKNQETEVLKLILKEYHSEYGIVVDGEKLKNIMSKKLGENIKSDNELILASYGLIEHAENEGFIIDDVIQIQKINSRN